MSGPADSESWRKISSLLDEVLDLPAGDREAWLAGLRARDAAAHEQIVRLLRADAAAESEGFLAGLPEVTAADDETEAGPPVSGRIPGDHVGPYSLEREIGRGGMGTVWLAVRSDGAVRRSVALKLPHVGVQDRAFLERFERERDILAGLTHPHVARLYDAGISSDGQPYLALEHVDGVPITDYCAGRSLTLSARIGLFLQVLDAVQYAHRNLVVHRDLKPSNILVREDGVAMLLDFGIAKILAAEGAPSGASDATRLGGPPMTPRYASPEQFGDGAVTTSSDVYSLGVVLFELLSGQAPYRVTGSSHRALQEAITSGETVPPSIAAGGAPSAAPGLPERRRLVRELRGDLDGILLKALERDPARRYPSAESFARDLKRYLHGEPVEARPHSRFYRTRKFVRRHRIGVSIAALVTIAVLGSLAFAIVQMRSAERERDRAGHVSSFLVSLFQVSDPSEAKGKTVTAREILDRGVAKIDDLGNEPLVQADLLITMGDVYRNLGLYGSAIPLLERSLALRRNVLGSDDYETMESINSLASALQEQGKLTEAEPLFREALERRRRVLGPLHKDTLNAQNNLGLVLQFEGKLAEAEPLFRESLAGKRRTLADGDSDLLPPISNLANLLKQEGKLAEARPLFLELVERAHKDLGDDDPHTWTAVSNLGLLLDAEGHVAEAEKHIRSAYEARLRLLGPNHPQTLISLNFLSEMLCKEGRLTEAEGPARDALAGLKKALGDDHPRTLAAQENLGVLLREQGKLDDAEPVLQACLESRRTKLGPDHSDTLASMHDLGKLLERRGRLDDAEPLERQAMERARAALGNESPLTILYIAEYGALRTAMGHATEAEPLIAGAVAVAQRVQPSTSSVIGRALLDHGGCLAALGRDADAVAAYTAAYTNLSESAPLHSGAAAEGLAALYDREGKSREAAEWRAKAAATRRS